MHELFSVILNGIFTLTAALMAALIPLIYRRPLGGDLSTSVEGKLHISEQENKIIGNYSGEYTALKEKNKLKLKVYRLQNKLTADLSFYPMQQNSGDSGNYLMSVTYNLSTDKYYFMGEKWIKQPITYVLADLEGQLLNNKISGDVFLGNDSPAKGCHIGTFCLSKS